jgi:hypothetical protein
MPVEDELGSTGEYAEVAPLIRRARQASSHRRPLAEEKHLPSEAPCSCLPEIPTRSRGL